MEGHYIQSLANIKEMTNRKIIKYLMIVMTSFILTSCSSNYLDLKEKITSNEKYNYAFYMDTWGIGDQGYYVLQLDKNIKPEDVYLEINMDGINIEQSEWVDKRTVLFNYAEAGFHTTEPGIKLIENRFLVFSRGGYFYSLYDINMQNDTFNIGSPWNAFRDKSKYSSEKFDRDKEEKAYTEWIKENVHKKIENYMQSEKMRK